MQEQKVENYPNWQTELHNCDFAKYAENCGGVGIKIKEPGDLERINTALAGLQAKITNAHLEFIIEAKKVNPDMSFGKGRGLAKGSKKGIHRGMRGM